jgi:hypothetical protein
LEASLRKEESKMEPYGLCDDSRGGRPDQKISKNTIYDDRMPDGVSGVKLRVLRLREAKAVRATGM